MIKPKRIFIVGHMGAGKMRQNFINVRLKSSLTASTKSMLMSFKLDLGVGVFAMLEPFTKTFVF